ncbi:hypothetical protein AYO38_03245 [bacterium SCGC AG-212-C10]|nr:hypothetical protein AYO38_03245 [bacterium SCGC AG-212-C10]
MPAELDRPEPLVSLSAPSELAFALFAFTCNTVRPDWIRSLLSPELVERVTSFWGEVPGERAIGDWSEVLLIAQRTNSLFQGDLNRFFSGIDAALAAGISVPPMRTETDEARSAITYCVNQLKHSPEVRARYITLLRDIWNSLRPEWESRGREETERRVRTLSDEIERSGDVRSVIPQKSIARRGRYEAILDAGIQSGEAVIVPLYFAGPGQFFTELDHVLVIAFGQEPGDSDRWREQAEVAATRFKLFSDPTRAAILSALTRSHYSVTDLAERFGLAQPTVSVHVKALRQGGLLESERFGAQTIYSARESTIRRVIGDATELLISPFASPPGDT